MNDETTMRESTMLDTPEMALVWGLLAAYIAFVGLILYLAWPL